MAWAPCMLHVAPCNMPGSAVHSHFFEVTPTPLGAASAGFKCRFSFFSFSVGRRNLLPLWLALPVDF